MAICSVRSPQDLKEPAGDVVEVRRQDGSRWFECHQCGRVFNKKSSIVCHMRLHTGEKPFVCTRCGSRFTHKSTLLHHAMLHTGEKPYQCEICHRKFRQRPHYTLHKKIHTQEKSFKCPVCGKQFAQRVHLTTHNRLHTGEKPYACRECDKRFFQRCHLTRHQKIHIGEKLLEYSGLGGLSCSTRLDSHLRLLTLSEPGIVSQHDSGLLRQGALFQRGEDEVHDVSNINSGKPKRQVMFECDVCHKTFRKKSNLKHHIFMHTGEKPFECIECGKRYRERRSVTRHREKVHNDGPTAREMLTEGILLPKPFPCKCESSYTPQSSLLNHSSGRRSSHTTLVPKESVQSLPRTDEEELLASKAEAWVALRPSQTSTRPGALAARPVLERQTSPIAETQATRGLGQTFFFGKSNPFRRPSGSVTPVDTSGTEATRTHLPRPTRDQALQPSSTAGATTILPDVEPDYDSVGDRVEDRCLVTQEEGREPSRSRCSVHNSEDKSTEYCVREETLRELSSCSCIASGEPLAAKLSSLHHRKLQTANSYPLQTEEPLAVKLSSRHHRKLQTANSYPSQTREEPLAVKLSALHHRKPQTANSYPSQTREERTEPCPDEQTCVWPGYSHTSVNLVLLGQPVNPMDQCQEEGVKQEIDIVEEAVEDGWSTCC